MSELTNCSITSKRNLLIAVRATLKALKKIHFRINTLLMFSIFHIRGNQGTVGAELKNTGGIVVIQCRFEV
jgi:hypothetical protein